MCTPSVWSANPGEAPPAPTSKVLTSGPTTRHLKGSPRPPLYCPVSPTPWPIRRSCFSPWNIPYLAVPHPLTEARWAEVPERPCHFSLPALRHTPSSSCYTKRPTRFKFSHFRPQPGRNAQPRPMKGGARGDAEVAEEEARPCSNTSRWLSSSVLLASVSFESPCLGLKRSDGAGLVFLPGGSWVFSRFWNGLRRAEFSSLQGSEVTQSCPTLCDPMDWLFHPRDSPDKNTGVGCRFLLQGIFPTQGLNPGLPHCRQTLYRLSHREMCLISPFVSSKELTKRARMFTPRLAYAPAVTRSEKTNPPGP